MSLILGLDPGLRTTGWGVLKVEGQKLIHVAHGTIAPSPKKEFSDRLRELFQGLQKIIELYQPTSAAVEETFVNTNASSTLKLGMARGVVLLAPSFYNLRVGEYSANHVKKTVVGAGHADKSQVMTMIQYLLPKCGQLAPDSADALAVAICHAHHLQTQQRWRATA